MLEDASFTIFACDVVESAVVIFDAPKDSFEPTAVVDTAILGVAETVATRLAAELVERTSWLTEATSPIINPEAEIEVIRLFVLVTFLTAFAFELTVVVDDKFDATSFTAKHEELVLVEIAQVDDAFTMVIPRELNGASEKAVIPNIN